MKNLSLILGLLIIALLIVFSSGDGRSVHSEKKSTEVRESKKYTPKAKQSISRLESIVDMPEAVLLNSSVGFIVGNEAEGQLLARDKASLSLKPDELKAADYQALLVFLEQAPGEKDDLLKFQSLKNDILIFLIKSGRYKYDLGEKLEKMLLSEEQHPVWREYVAQFIPEYFEQYLTGHLIPEEEEIMQSLTDGMWQMTEVEQGALAGTALLKLHQLSKGFDHISEDKVNIIAVEMLNNSHLDDASRMGALDVLCKNGQVEHLEVISDLVLDQQAPVLLRMAAIHGAYQLSNKDESFALLLQENILDQESDKRLVTVVQKLLKNQ